MSRCSAGSRSRGDACLRVRSRFFCSAFSLEFRSRTLRHSAGVGHMHFAQRLPDKLQIAVACPDCAHNVFLDALTSMIDAKARAQIEVQLRCGGIGGQGSPIKP